MNLRPADYESDGVRKARAATRRKPTGFSDGVGQGDRDRTYAEAGVGRFGVSVEVSGRCVSGFPDRTSELGANT